MVCISFFNNFQNCLGFFCAKSQISLPSLSLYLCFAFRFTRLYFVRVEIKFVYFHR